MSVVYAMMEARFALGGEEAEAWVLGGAAMKEWEAEGQRNSNYMLPAAPPGVRYERQFQGVPVIDLRSGYHPNRVELHSRDQRGEPTIRVLRY